MECRRESVRVCEFQERQLSSKRCKRERAWLGSCFAFSAPFSSAPAHQKHATSPQQVDTPNCHLSTGDFKPTSLTPAMYCHGAARCRRSKGASVTGKAWEGSQLNGGPCPTCWPDALSERKSDLFAQRASKAGNKASSADRDTLHFSNAYHVLQSLACA